MSKIHLPSRPKNAGGLSIQRNHRTQTFHQPTLQINNPQRLSISTWNTNLRTTKISSSSISITLITKDPFCSFTKGKSLLRGYNLFSNQTFLKRSYSTNPEKQKPDAKTKETVETLFKVGLKHLQMRNFADAIPVFNDLAGLVTGPTKVPALVYKAMALFEMGIIDIADQTLDEALTLAPKHVVARVYKGACLTGLSKFQQAYDVLKAIKDEWEKVKEQLDFRAQTVFFLNHALAACETQRVDEALQSFDSLDMLDKRAIFEIFGSCFLRGACYMEKQEWQKALHCFNQELAEIPKVPSEKIATTDITAVHRETLLNRAVALTQLKRNEEALQSWEDILNQFTSDDPLDMTTRITAWEHKAHVYMHMKKSVEALHAAEETKRLIERMEEMVTKYRDMAKDDAQELLKKQAAEQTRIVEESMSTIKRKSKEEKKEDKKKQEQADFEKEVQKYFKEAENNPVIYDMVSQMYLRGAVPQIYDWIQTRGVGIRMSLILFLLLLLVLNFLRKHSQAYLPQSSQEEEEKEPVPAVASPEEPVDNTSVPQT